MHTHHDQQPLSYNVRLLDEAQEINRCWRLYDARNCELAHLAANLLLLFASVCGCSLISGESLGTLNRQGLY